MSAAFTYYYRSLDFEKYVQKKYQIQLGGPAEASSQRPDTGEAPGMSAHRLFSGNTFAIPVVHRGYPLRPMAKAGRSVW